MADKTPILVWLREDLRVQDNPALYAACETGRLVIALYILESNYGPYFTQGAASRWWLHHSLSELAKSLHQSNISLCLKRGAAKAIIPEIINQSGADTIFWNRRYGSDHIETDKAIKAELQKSNMNVESFNGKLLFEPWAVKSGTGGPYKVFTPFWKACLKSPSPRAPIAVAKATQPAPEISSDRLDAWGLLPNKPNWANRFTSAWRPGEAAARQKLNEFLTGAIDGYGEKRNRPDLDFTSRLSPHLAFGEISPNTIWHAVHNHLDAENIPASEAQKFLSEIGWREFSWSLLYHNPNMTTEELQPAFAEFPWQHNQTLLTAWQKGNTGFPIVDAGMRQLWQTGWMHNRVRMVVGSFLVKHLLLDWRDGMAWFWDTLVDADYANNTASWQWIAGCGADAAPYFRVFNPIIQGEKFDPHGSYVRAFVPELAKLPNKYIHKPWDAPEDILAAAGIKLGHDYPRPIIKHERGREQALEAYSAMKNAQISDN